MLYPIDENKPTRELHLVMLSPSTSGSNIPRADGTRDSRLFFYVNRSCDEVMRNPLAFANAPLAVDDVALRGFEVMPFEPKRFKIVAYGDCTLPDAQNVGVVLRFKLESNIENPTKAIADLGKSLAEALGVSLFDVKFSGSHSQEDPMSYEELNMFDFPDNYFNINAIMALPEKTRRQELVAS